MIDWAFPRKHLFAAPDPPDAKHIQPAVEARYWVELRGVLGDLVLYSQLYPDSAEPAWDRERS